MKIPKHASEILEPTTIPFPDAAAEGLEERNLRIAVGRELHARLAARPPRLGWDAERQRWANIPVHLDRNLPPRAMVTERHDGSERRTTIAILSWIGDVDDPHRSRRKALPRRIT